MFDLQHELSKINLKDAEVTIPRDGDSSIIRLSAITREKLKTWG